MAYENQPRPFGKAWGTVNLLPIIASREVGMSQEKTSALTSAQLKAEACYLKRLYGGGWFFGYIVGNADNARHLGCDSLCQSA